MGLSDNFRFCDLGRLCRFEESSARISEVLCTIAIHSGEAAGVRPLHLERDSTERIQYDGLFLPAKDGGSLGYQGVDQIEEFLSVGNLLA